MRKLVGVALVVLSVGCATVQKYNPFGAPVLVDEVSSIRLAEGAVAQLVAELAATSGISEVRRANSERALALAVAELREADNLHSISGLAEPPHDKIAALVEAARVRCNAVRFGLSR